MTPPYNPRKVKEEPIYMNTEIIEIPSAEAQALMRKYTEEEKARGSQREYC